MGGNPDSDDIDDDEGDEEGGNEELDLDRVFKDMEVAKRRAVKGSEPAWRKLEQRMEQKHTAELISDFDDYDIGDGESRPARRRR